MATPSILNTWTASSGARVTQLTVTVGTITENNLLVAHCFQDKDSGGMTQPGGWTYIGGLIHSSGAIRQEVWAKVATASEPSSYTWLLNGTDEMGIVLFEFVGADNSATMSDNIQAAPYPISSSYINPLPVTAPTTTGDFGYFATAADAQVSITTGSSGHTEWGSNPFYADNDATLLVSFKDTAIVPNYDPGGMSISGVTETATWAIVIRQKPERLGQVSAVVDTTVNVTARTTWVASTSVSADISVSLIPTIIGIKLASVSVSAEVSTEITHPFVKQGQLSVTVDTSVIATPYTAAILTSSAFRFRWDDGSETEAQWITDANNVHINLGSRRTYRLRFVLEDTSAGAGCSPQDLDLKMEYKINAGAWTSLYSFSSDTNVSTTTSTYYSTSTPSTQQISTGGVFYPAFLEEGGNSIPNTHFEYGSKSEFEYILHIGTDAAPGSTLSIRIYSTDAGINMVQTQVPVCLVVANVLPTLTLDHYRARNDDNTEILATWQESLDTLWNEDVSDNFRLRFAIYNSTACVLTPLKLNLVYTDGSAPKHYYRTAIPEVKGTVDSERLGYGLAISGNGLVLAASNLQLSSVIKIYDYNAATQAWDFDQQITTGASTTGGLALNNDGSILAYGYNGDVVIKSRTVPGTFSTRDTFSAIRPAGYGELSLDSSGNRIAIADATFNSNRGRIIIYDYTTSWALYQSVEGGLVVDQYFAGGGGVTLSADGLSLAGSSTGTSSPKIIWYKDNGSSFVEILNWVIGTSTKFANNIRFFDGDNSMVFTETGVDQGWVYIYDKDTDGQYYIRTDASLTEPEDYWSGVSYGVRVAVSADGGRLSVAHDLWEPSPITSNWGATITYAEDDYYIPVPDNTDTVEPIRMGSSTFVDSFDNTTQQISSPDTFRAGHLIELAQSDYSATFDTVGSVEVEYVLEANSLVLIDPTVTYKFRLEAAMFNVRGWDYRADYLAGYTESTATMSAGLPNVEQKSFRGRLDDNYETLATWKAALNTDWDEVVGTLFRIRFALKNTQGTVTPAQSWVYKLQSNKNLAGTIASIGDPLVSNEPTDSNRFGFGAAVSGNGLVLAVGSPYGNSSKGQVEIFDLTAGAWVYRGLVTATAGAANDDFGYDVALNTDGSILYVGAPRADRGGTDRGCVYRFTWGGSSWTEDATIIDADWKHTDYQDSSKFGTGVAVSLADDVLVVGAPDYNPGGLIDAGKVYVFRRDGGLYISDGVIGNSNSYWEMGYSVTVSGDGSSLGFGAPRYSSNLGLIFFADYESSVWTLRSYGLGGSAAAARFGEAIQMNRNGLVTLVGAPNYDGWKGAIYIIDWDGTDTAGGLVNRQGWAYPVANTQFGSSVVMTPDNESILIGAKGYDTPKFEMGAVYPLNMNLTWEDMAAQSDPTASIRYADSIWITDKELTTQQISSPDTFLAGDCAESNGAEVTWDGAKTTEMEYVVKTVSAYSINNDTYRFRIITDWNEAPLTTYTEYPFINILSGEKAGVVSCTAECTVNAVVVETHEGIVDAVVDCTVVATTYLTGVVAVSIDNSVAIVPTMSLGGKCNALTGKIETAISGRVAKRGELVVTWGCRCFPKGSLDLNASINLTSLSSIIADAQNFVNGVVSSNIDCSVNVLAKQEISGVVLSAIDTTTGIVATINNEAYVYALSYISTSVKGSLTFGAKCVIIGAVNVNIDSSNYKYVNLSLAVDTTVTPSATLLRGAAVSTSSFATVYVTPTLTRSAPVTASSHIYVSIAGDVISPCIKNYSDITSPSNISDIDQTINSNNITCGE